MIQGRRMSNTKKTHGTIKTITFTTITKGRSQDQTAMMRHNLQGSLLQGKIAKTTSNQMMKLKKKRMTIPTTLIPIVESLQNNSTITMGQTRSPSPFTCDFSDDVHFSEELVFLIGHKDASEKSKVSLVMIGFFILFLFVVFCEVVLGKKSLS